MLFDSLCGIIERHFGDFTTAMRHARLHALPGDPKSEPGLPAVLTAEHPGFKMPHSIMAIELARAMVLLVDSEPGQVGFKAPRAFVVYVPINLADKEMNETITATFGPRSGMLLVGNLTGYQYDPTVLQQVRALGRVFWWSIVSKEDVLQKPAKPRGDQEEDLTKYAMQACVAAVESLIWYSPPRFDHASIGPALTTEGLAKPKILRTPERPVYHPVPAKG